MDVHSTFWDDFGVFDVFGVGTFSRMGPTVRPEVSDASAQDGDQRLISTEVPLKPDRQTDLQHNFK